MKNKLYILSLTLLCAVQSASCMDEQQIVPMEGSVAFNGDTANYFSKLIRKLANVYLGINIKKSTPCIFAIIYPDNKDLAYQTLHLPIPLKYLIANNTNNKIVLPKAHLRYLESSDELELQAKKFEENFLKIAEEISEKDLNYFNRANLVMLTYDFKEDPSIVQEEMQQYCKKEILFKKTYTSVNHNSPITYCEHGPRGYGSPLQGKEGNIFELLMRRQKIGSFKK